MAVCCLLKLCVPTTTFHVTSSSPQRILYKLKSRFPPEIDAAQLQSILRTFCCNFALGGFNPIGGPTMDLCRAMVALRDPALGGRLSLEHVPALISLLRFWKAAFRRCRPFNSGTLTISRGTWWAKVSSYSIRGLLWAGEATASNKVIEALVSRFTRNRHITLEGYLMSMARLHLAHGEKRFWVEQKYLEGGREMEMDSVKRIED